MWTGMKVLFVAGRWAQDVQRSEGLEGLKKIADVEVLESADNKMLVEKVQNVDIIITGGPIPGGVIRAGNKLRMIQTTSVGYEYIDEKAAEEKGVIICNVAGVNANSVAELCFGMIIDIARRISAHNISLRAGGWDRIEPDRQVEIRGRTIGIIGLGAVGSNVAQIAKSAFRMNILTYDPYITEARAEQFGAKMVDLSTLMKESDIVTVHVPLNLETKHMIGEKELSLLKRTAIFMNTSRGPVVDEKALIKILGEGRISGACLDVFEVEPLPKDNPLRGMNNVSIVPHIGSTPEVLGRMRETAIWNVVRVIKGQTPMNIQTPKTFYSNSTWKVEKK
jgi:D-3-phosphoglycerate dehydrogenase